MTMQFLHEMLRLGLGKELSNQDFCSYFIVLELLQLHVPNQDKLRKSLMQAHLGDYEKIETTLVKNVY